MAMTKDKAGNYIFRKGGEYRIREFVNPVWTPGKSSICLDTRSWEYDGVTVENGMGQFQNGDDTRWWVASSQFEEA